MNNIAKWVRINGTFMALADGNVLVGFIKPIDKTFKVRSRPPDEFK